MSTLNMRFVFFSPLRRGFVFGLWSACAPVGNILGAFLASSVLTYGYEVRCTHAHRLYRSNLLINYADILCFAAQYAFLVTSVVQLAGGVVVFFGLLVSPKEVGK